MSDNEENIKVKLSLNNLGSRAENKTNPSSPSESEERNIPSDFKPASEPSLTGSQESLKLKLKIPETQLSEIEEKKNIPVQEVKLKLKPIKSTSVTADKKDISLQPSSKNSEQTPLPSNHQTEHKAEETLSNFVNTQEAKNTDKTYDSIGNITASAAKSTKEKIKYFYIAGALVVIIILLYLMISTINTLMTI